MIKILFVLEMFLQTDARNWKLQAYGACVNFNSSVNTLEHVEGLGIYFFTPGLG